MMAFQLPSLERASSLSHVNLPNMTGLLSFSLLALFVAFVVRSYRRSKRMPPGPMAYPIMGVLPKIKQEFHSFLFEESLKFNGIFSAPMGQVNMVVLSDVRLIKKALGSRDFIHRPKTPLFQDLLKGFGIINSEKALWKSQRRFLLHQKLGMRHWGAGMEHIEERIQFESINLIENLFIEQKDSLGIDPEPFLNSAVANVVCSVIMSIRFDANDPKFIRFMDLFDEGFKLFNETGTAMFFPPLQYLPGAKNIFNKLSANRQEMLAFSKYIIQEHKNTLDEEAPRDLIDSYLIRMADTVNNNEDLFHGYNPEEQLEQIILDLFSAGVETIKTTIRWGIVYMLHYPEVMAKIQSELEQVLGSERMPTIQDMPNLPYTRATICEILRRSTPVPLATTHSCERDVEFEGYLIPKNTQVIPLIHAVHMNPDNWENPEEFRPERFLTEDGSDVIKSENFIPFSVGQRMCLGDKLAEKELFIFFASLLHVTNIVPSSGELPSLRGEAGVTIKPHKFSVNFIPKNIEALTNARHSLPMGLLSEQCLSFK